MAKPDFDKDDAAGCTAEKGERRLDEALLSEEGLRANEWKEGSVEISMPMEKVKHKSEEEAPRFKVSGILHCSISQIVRATCAGSNARHMELIPHQLYRRDADGTETRYYSEVYNGNAMLEEDAKMRARPRNPEDGPDVEYAIFYIILYSDSTRLANFGSASMWPAYMFSGNISKYLRSKAGVFPAEHVAYLPKVSAIPAFSRF